MKPTTAASTAAPLNPVVASFAPIREKTRQILADEPGLDRILAHGAARARQVAGQTMTAVRDRIGLLKAQP